jgi:hypothetical protein
VIKKSRFVLALGLVMALGVSGLAFGDGASDNDAFVDGSLKKTKLPKKDYVKNELFSGVRTETHATLGTQSNPLTEYLSYPKNMKFDLNAGSTCDTLPPSGSTPEQAQAACPKDSYVGKGAAEVIQPSGARIQDIVVSVFKGPAKNGIQLHTYSPTLQAASPTVPGSIVKSNAGSQFGQALSVPHAPETGALMITKFNATIFKSSGSILSRCKSKTMTFQRKTTYADGSSETAETTQKCKRKK